jgi:hypothetical protein
LLDYFVFSYSRVFVVELILASAVGVGCGGRVMKRLLSLFCFFILSCAPRDDTPPNAVPENVGEPNDVVAPLKLPDALQARIDAAIANVRNRDLRTTNHFWMVFHGILGLGPDVTLLDDATGKRVNALERICTGTGIDGLVFIATRDGLDVESQPGTGVGQGHQDQFVAEMVQWGVSPDRKVELGEKHFTFADFFRHSKARTSVTRGDELSWAIVIVSEHFGTAHKWTNAFGETVTCEDVVRYELNQPIDTAACGGTHRLFGLTWAYHRHGERGGATTGVWKDVAEHIELYKKKAREFQNRDGSFSTAYVSEAQNRPELGARIAGTGHVLEWLALALTDAELREPWMQDAASALAVMILENQNNPIDGGALYHAVHGLYIYRARVFGVAGPQGLTIPSVPKT